MNEKLRRILIILIFAPPIYVLDFGFFVFCFFLVGLLVFGMMVCQVVMCLIKNDWLDFEKEMYLYFFFGVFYFPIKKWVIYYHTGIYIHTYGLEETDGDRIRRKLADELYLLSRVKK